MQFAKDIGGTKKPQAGSLIAILNQTVPKHRPGRSVKELRASMLTSEKEFCPREIALLDHLKKEPKMEHTGVAQQVAFDQGESLHRMFREEWLGDRAVGDWKCQHCGGAVNFTKRPGPCKKCGGKRWSYMEVRITSDELGVSGGLDTLVNCDDSGKLTLVEVKTMVTHQYDTIVAPLAEHRLRTNFYLRLLQGSTQVEADYIHKTAAKVLYISKGYGKKNDFGQISPFKEFDVTYSADLAEVPSQKASIVKEWRLNPVGFPQGICPHALAPRVKSCACGAECWSGSFK